jgi:hypothetical protein
LYPAPYSVTTWPEESNRNAPEIDAYAEAPASAPLAIEVTKIESFTDQRFDDRRIEELSAALEPRLRASCPTGVDVLLPVGVIRPGFDWKEIVERMEAYLLELCSRLTAGGSWHSIPGIPFRIFVNFQPDLQTPFAFGRTAPSNEARRSALLASTEKALRHKRDRLEEYRKGGARAVLILESHDIALISHVNVYTAFREARKRTGSAHLDHVWFCRTYNPHRLGWYGFLGPQELLDSVNQPNLRLGPKHEEYWEGQSG